MATPLSKRARWAVPVVAAAVVAGAFTLPSALASDSPPDLADITADELVQKIAAADPVPMSGTVVYTARLGLPDLNLSSMQGAGPLDLLGGSTTVRLWTDGADGSRATLLGDLSEYTVVHNGSEVWTYSSSDNEAVKYTVDPAELAEYKDLAAAAEAADSAATDIPTPEAVADMALAYARMTSDVVVEPAAEIAGRDAYQLSVEPKTDGTLVDRVLIAVDAETFVPLRAQVWSTQDTVTPAVEIGFTDVSFDAPDASVFDFTTPPGATERTVEIPLPDTASLPSEEDAAAQPDGVSVSGTGWETVVQLTDVDIDALLAGAMPSEEEVRDELEESFGSDAANQLFTDLMGDGEEQHDAMTLDLEQLFDQLTTDVPEGRLISSSLLTILITDDGRVFAGAVPAETLQALAR